MNHGNQSSKSTSASIKNVIISSQSESTNLPAGSSGTPPEITTTENQEEKVHVFKKVEQAMEDFRGGQNSRFPTLTNVIDELDKWSGASDKDRERTLNTYMAELNSIITITNGNELRSNTLSSRSSILPDISQKKSVQMTTTSLTTYPELVMKKRKMNQC
jgi:hypothetical protein